MCLAKMAFSLLRTGSSKSLGSEAAVGSDAQEIFGKLLCIRLRTEALPLKRGRAAYGPADSSFRRGSYAYARYESARE